MTLHWSLATPHGNALFGGLDMESHFERPTDGINRQIKFGNLSWLGTSHEHERDMNQFKYVRNCS